MSQKLENNTPCFDTLLPEALIGGSLATADHSHYLEPLAEAGLRGFSRRWADAPKGVQLQAISTLITEAYATGLNSDETALLLAITHVESGFNPDAAAQQSSATGLGQFIDRTGKAYGLTSLNRFDLKANAKALIRHLKDNFALAKKRGLPPLTYGYAFHHDGPSLSYGGLKIAKERVLPLMENFRKCLR